MMDQAIMFFFAGVIVALFIVWLYDAWRHHQADRRPENTALVAKLQAAQIKPCKQHYNVRVYGDLVASAEFYNLTIDDRGVPELAYKSDRITFSFLTEEIAKVRWEMLASIEDRALKGQPMLTNSEDGVYYLNFGSRDHKPCNLYRIVINKIARTLYASTLFDDLTELNIEINMAGSVLINEAAPRLDLSDARSSNINNLSIGLFYSVDTGTFGLNVLHSLPELISTAIVLANHNMMPLAH